MFSVTWRGSDMGAIWSMAVQPAMQVCAAVARFLGSLLWSKRPC